MFRLSDALRRRTKPSGKRKTVLFLAGKPSHGYGAHDHLAGCMLLAKSLDDSGLPIESSVYHYDWPKDERTLRRRRLRRHVRRRRPGPHGHPPPGSSWTPWPKKASESFALHYAVEVPKGEAGEKFLDWIGGYFETDWSVNPTWTAHFTSLPKHPITRGVEPFAIEDEWYYHMRFRDGMKGVTPILTALPPPETLSRPDDPHAGNPFVRAAIARKEPQHVAWAVERDDGGRGFGFTGGHFHWNWADPNFRKLVLNAIVWCAKIDVPPDGVRISRRRWPTWKPITTQTKSRPRISTAKRSARSTICRRTLRAAVRRWRHRWRNSLAVLFPGLDSGS